MCGLNNADFSPLLCTPKVFREYLVSNINTSGSLNKQYVPLAHYALSSNNSSGNLGNTSGSGSTSGSGGVSSRSRRVAAMVVDKLSDRGGYRFPVSSGLLAGEGRC